MKVVTMTGKTFFLSNVISVNHVKTGTGINVVTEENIFFFPHANLEYTQRPNVEVEE
jgi:hypothetical protein